MKVNIKKYLKIARPDHWIKQFFIFPGILFALFIMPNHFSVNLCLNIIMSFIATSLIASANYVINEWLDAEFDKFHPIKKYRPIVTDGIKVKYVILEYVILSIIGLVISYKINIYVFYMEFALLVMGIVYNVKPLRSKEIPYIDVLSESINNAIRLLIGWFVVTQKFLPPISIVLGYWLGGAFLMATKRYAEYRMINNKSQASLYRKSFKYYNEKKLLISAFFYALLSVFFCGIFMIKYKIELLLSIPFLCGLFCLYLNISYKEDSSAQKPEKLFKEKWLMLYLLIFIILFSALLFIEIPILNIFLETTILTI